MLLDRLLRVPKFITEFKQRVTVNGMNLETDFNDTIEKALIIPGPLKNRAMESARILKIQPVLLDSFYFPDRFNCNPVDYMSDAFRCVEIPRSFDANSWPHHIKLYSQQLNYYQVCRILNHMIAWDYSVRNNEPVIILENDAVLLSRHKHNNMRFNSITMLADTEYYYHNNNWICAKGVYAYAIDAFTAKNLFNKVMTEGLVNPLELMFRIDELNISLAKKACRIQPFASIAASLDSY